MTHLPIRIRVAGLIQRGESVLVLRQEKHDRRYWLLPGGGVDPGETLRDALLRELEEECALEPIAVMGPIAIAESIGPATTAAAKHIVHIVYDVDVDPGALPRVRSYDAAVRNHELVPRSDLTDLDLRPPIQRFVARYRRGDPFVSLGRVWVS